MIFRQLAAILLMIGAFEATACKVYGLEHEVNFSEGSASMSATEILALTNWYLERRDGWRGVFDASISAYSKPRNFQSGKLTQRRTRVVAELIASLSEGREIPLQVYVEPLSTPRREAYATVVVITQPMCLKTRTCCTWDVQRHQ